MKLVMCLVEKSWVRVANMLRVFFVAIKIQNFLCNHSDQKNNFLFLKKTKQKVVNFVKPFMSYIGWVRFLLCMLFGIRHITSFMI